MKIPSLFLEDLVKDECGIACEMLAELSTRMTRPHDKLWNVFSDLLRRYLDYLGNFVAMLTLIDYTQTYKSEYLGRQLENRGFENRGIPSDHGLQCNQYCQDPALGLQE